MILRILLLPFALLYQLITWVRNRLYDIGLKPSASFDLPLINVGNLTVGGTGKTPMVEYIIRLLSERYKVATLSRGYKRDTKGFRIASPGDNAATIGDEPFQFYRKFKDRITVSVGEDRAFAIPSLLHEHNDTEVILLDDAYQHRKIKPSFNILITDYNRPFYTDFLLPAGRLRESRSGAKRADVVVVTKCPDSITSQEAINMEASIRNYVNKPIFFSSIIDGTPLPFAKTISSFTSKIILLTGIAQPKPLVDYVSQNFTLVEHIQFPDHYAYKLGDLEMLRNKVRAISDVTILTTEKDMVKLEAEE